MNGEAGGLFELPPPTCPLIAVDGDNYVADDAFLSQLAEAHSQGDYLATIGVASVPDIARYANVDLDSDGMLIAVQEKPHREDAYGDLAKLGCYVLDPALINRGESFFRGSNQEVSTTTAFANALREAANVRCVRYDGVFLDIGTLDAYSQHLLNFRVDV